MPYRFLLISLLLTVFLSGCASMEVLDKELKSLEGREVSEAASIFGPPNTIKNLKAQKETPICDGETAYIWRDNKIYSNSYNRYNFWCEIYICTKNNIIVQAKRFHFGQSCEKYIDRIKATKSR